MDKELSSMIAEITAEIDNEIFKENVINLSKNNILSVKKLGEDEVDSILEDRMYKSYNLRVEDVETMDEKVEKRKAFLDEKYNFSSDSDIPNIEEEKEVKEGKEEEKGKEEITNIFLRYGKGLPHDEKGNVKKKNFKSLLRAIKKGTVESYNKVFNGCPEFDLEGNMVRRKFQNLQSCDAFDLYGEDISTFLFSNSSSSSERLEKERFEEEEKDENEEEGEKEKEKNSSDMNDFLNILVRDLECLYFLEYQRDLPIDCISLPSSHSKFFQISPEKCGQNGITLSKFIKDIKVFHGRESEGCEKNKNYMVNFDDWLKVQKGYKISPKLNEETKERKKDRKGRNIVTGRDLAFFVYEKENDPLEFFLQLTDRFLKEKQKGKQMKEEERIKEKKNNPYTKYKNRESNLAFGKYSIYSLLVQAAERALKYASYLKWNVCLIPRPEELAYHLSESIEGKENNVRFLSQVYPEGSNVSPSYPCGKMSVVAACSTILKAFFDFSKNNTLDEELNLLIYNWALGTLLSGTNYPTDVKDGIILGEKVAISLLRSHLSTLTEDFKGFYFTSFANEDVYVSL